MTTTNVFEGVSEGKPSSRVLAPPGGGGSDIFGTGLGTAPPPPVKTGRGCQGNQRNQSSILGGGEEPSQPSRGGQRSNDQGNNIFGPAETRNPPPPRGDDNIFAASPSSQAQGGKAKAGVNPITGVAYGQPKPQDVHTSTRVKQPPGGASSGLW